MIGGSVADIEECLADDCDDHRVSELQFSARSDAKRKFDFRPTKHNLAKLAPFRFCRYLSHNSAGLVPGRILKCNVKVAILFCSQVNYATCESIPFLFRPDAF